MKNIYETRYLVTDIVAVPVVRIRKKSEAYRQATEDGWGTVYIPYENGEPTTLICSEDCSAELINRDGESVLITSNEELNPKEWPKQADCVAIIMGDSCGYSFWEQEPGLVKIYVTYDEDGFIDNYRICNCKDTPYDGNILINFEDLPIIDPYEG